MNIKGYPFRTARVVDGKTFIEIEELEEILTNLEKLSPVLKQVADSTTRIRDAFADGKSKTDNLLVELKDAEGNLKGTLGEF